MSATVAVSNMIWNESKNSEWEDSVSLSTTEALFLVSFTSIQIMIGSLSRARLRGGGGTLAKCQGPRAFGGPADFLGLAVVYGPVFSGPHCTVLGEHIYVVGRWGTTF